MFVTLRNTGASILLLVLSGCEGLRWSMTYNPETNEIGASVYAPLPREVEIQK